MNKEGKVRDYDEKIRREFTGGLAKSVTVLCVVWGIMQMAVASQFLTISPMKLKILHLAFALVICFITIPATSKSPINRFSVIDMFLIMGSLASLGYLFFRWNTLIRMGGYYSDLDIWMGILLIAVLFIGAIRATSLALVILAMAALLFTYFGRSMPGPFIHTGYSINRIVQHMYMTGEGIFSFILGISSSIIIIFVLLGAFLQEVKVIDFFFNFANALTGWTRGGPAKIAVFSSALMGMVTGETSANVATTGAITIPLMKKTGYPNHFAGAVECSASAGGQILPPVMGATAFVIADTLGIPYIELAKSAFIPAVLYYFGVFMTVHFRAVKLGLEGLPRDQVPNIWTVLKTQGYMALPIITLIILLIKQYTPVFSAFWGGIVVVCLISYLNKDNRLTLSKFINAVERGTKTAVGIAITTAVVGLIVGAASLTGVTMTVSNSILQLTKGAILPTLFLTMIISIILGCGLPTTAVYVLASISAAPILTQLGFETIAAHLFVFYFGVFSTITPPVATGAFTAAAICNSNHTKVGFTALKISIAGLLVPYLFIFNPQLLLLNSPTLMQVTVTIMSTAAGILFLSSSIEGIWFNGVIRSWQRLMLMSGALLLIWPGIWTDVIGFALGFISLTLNFLEKQANTKNLAS